MKIVLKDMKRISRDTNVDIKSKSGISWVRKYFYNCFCFNLIIIKAIVVNEMQKTAQRTREEEIKSSSVSVNCSPGKLLIFFFLRITHFF